MLRYGVASVIRIDKFVGLFFKRKLQNKRCSTEETYNFIDPTNQGHPIVSNATKYRGIMQYHVSQHRGIIQYNALLLKNFHLHLHSYTLMYP